MDFYIFIPFHNGMACGYGVIVVHPFIMDLRYLHRLVAAFGTVLFNVYRPSIQISRYNFKIVIIAALIHIDYVAKHARRVCNPAGQKACTFLSIYEDIEYSILGFLSLNSPDYTPFTSRDMECGSCRSFLTAKALHRSPFGFILCGDQRRRFGRLLRFGTGRGRRLWLWIHSLRRCWSTTGDSSDCQEGQCGANKVSY